MGEDRAALVLQDALPQVLGLDLGDEHEDVLLGGRTHVLHDRLDQPPVVVVNEVELDPGIPAIEVVPDDETETTPPTEAIR